MIREHIDVIRRKCGLSRPQMLSLLNLKQASQLRDVDVANRAKDEADAIEASYTAYLAAVRRRLAAELDRPVVVLEGVPHLSTVQTARVLGVGEFHLANIRERGRIVGHKLGRRAVYSEQELRRFIQEPMGANSPYSALALAFLRWRENVTTT